jgi:hypothetical protein
MGTKAYLGDGVYVDLDSGMIKLTTEDGIQATNTIYLEAEVYQNFIQWVKRLQVFE